MYLLPFKDNNYSLNLIIDNLNGLNKTEQRQNIISYYDNMFLTTNQKNIILKYFRQCIYFNIALKTYISNFRKKKHSLITPVNDQDLIMESDYTNHERFNIVNDNGHKYWFSVNDVKQIITNSLENSLYCVPEPQRPSNPYTKEEFKTKEIEDMIKFLKKNNATNTMIDIYENYIDDMEMMVQMHYLYFCKKAIKQYVEDFEKDEVIDNIIDLSWRFLRINVTKSIVDKNKSHEQLNSLFGHIIKKYYLHRRMNNRNIITRMSNEIRDELREIIYNDVNSYNPKIKFRRIVKVKRDHDGRYIGSEPSSQRQRIEPNLDSESINTNTIVPNVSENIEIVDNTVNNNDTDNSDDTDDDSHDTDDIETDTDDTDDMPVSEEPHNNVLTNQNSAFTTEMTFSIPITQPLGVTPIEHLTDLSFNIPTTQPIENHPTQGMLSLPNQNITQQNYTTSTEQNIIEGANHQELVNNIQTNIISILEQALGVSLDTINANNTQNIDTSLNGFPNIFNDLTPSSTVQYTQDELDEELDEEDFDY